MVTTLIFGFFVLLFLAVPVGHVLVIASGAAILSAGEFPVMLVAQQMVNQTLSFPMLALPFFILSGSLMMSGRLGEKLIGFARELVQRLVDLEHMPVFIDLRSRQPESSQLLKQPGGVVPGEF